MYTIIEEDEPVPVTKALIAVLFGEPGVSKTSLAFTADIPLLMDFDDGVRRAVGRKTTVKFMKWAEVEVFTESDELRKRGVKTLIIDTAGVMLDDYMSTHIIALDSKYGNGAGGLGLKGFGIQKSTFGSFLNRCGQLGVENLIFICHTAKDGDDDNSRLKPKLTGGSYDTLISKADLVGYLEMRNNKATLNFSPTTRHIGKNSAEFPLIELPHYQSKEWPTFMSDILRRTRERLNRMSEKQVEAVKTVNEFKERIAEVTTMEELDTMIEAIDKLTQVYKVQVTNLWSARYADLFKVLYFTDKVQTVEDFNTLSEVMKGLSKEVTSNLIEPLRELQNKHNVVYDKVKHTYIVKPVVPTTPAADDKAKQGAGNATNGESPPKEEKAKRVGNGKQGSTVQSTLPLEQGQQ